MTLLDTFLSKIKIIKELQPKYVKGGDGSRGTCDCIGLVIGALRRSGIKYSGVHGSNWFARKEINGLSKVNGIQDLKVGIAVFQTYEPWEAGYDLPSRYKKGGQNYNGDVRDYMHIGIVTSLDPLEITHMWQPSVKVDTTLKWWTYKGWLKKIPETTPSQGDIQEETATVTATSGATVRMRSGPGTNYKILHAIKIGTTVTVLEHGDSWTKIEWNGKTGYMMTKFLKM